MSILDEYKKSLADGDNTDFPVDTNLTENDKEAYKEALRKMRSGDFSTAEIREAINNSRKNMGALDEKHNGGRNEEAITHDMVRVTDEYLMDNGLLREEELSKISVIRAYCPKCGKELVSKAPPMYNPFTMQKVCLHECSCGEKYNLDNSYPHIAFFDNNGEEIKTFS